MGLFDAISISGSGLSAERLRMDVTAENLANAQSTRGADGQPYRRKEVILKQADGNFESALRRASANGSSSQTPVGRGVEVSAIVEDTAPNRQVYDPGHPDANQQGYVEMPNVDSVTEMVDLISSSRAYEANVTAMQTAKSMFARTLDLLK
jgi:flagellar basal-body rod protein FlgC